MFIQSQGAEKILRGPGEIERRLGFERRIGWRIQRVLIKVFLKDVFDGLVCVVSEMKCPLTSRLQAGREVLFPQPQDALDFAQLVQGMGTFQQVLD